MIKNFEILQLTDNKENHNYRFAGLELLQRLGLSFDLKRYENVFTGECDFASDSVDEQLDYLYACFQGGQTGRIYRSQLVRVGCDSYGRGSLLC